MLVKFPEPALLQVEKSQLCQPLLCQMLQLLHHLCGPALDSSQHIHVSQVLRGPSTESQMYFSRAEQRGRDHLPWHAGSALSGTARRLLALFAAGGFCCPMVNLFTRMHSASRPQSCPEVSSPYLPVYGVIQPHADNVSWLQMEGLRNLLPGIHKSQQDLTGD